MADEQPKLLNGPDKKSLGGPVFEPGPGWGFYVKRWLKKYFLKIAVPVLIVVAAVWVFTASKSTENGREITNAGKAVKVVVARGDSRALLARKALVEYLKENPEKSLSGGQKIFIEETLRRKMEAAKLVIGESAEFKVEDIKTAITQAEALTPLQLEAWENYAQKVKLD